MHSELVNRFSKTCKTKRRRSNLTLRDKQRMKFKESQTKIRVNQLLQVYMGMVNQHSHPMEEQMAENIMTSSTNIIAMSKIGIQSYRKTIR